MAEVQKQDDGVERAELHAPSSPPVNDHQRELANQAMTDFENGHYDQCAQTMNKLLNQRPNDPKVVHNKAVCEFYKNKVSKKEFRQGLSKVCDLYHIRSENAENVEDVDHGIVYYNQAVLLYRLHQYKTAIAILDKLFQFVEPLEEVLAKKVMFLLVELYLCTNQPEKGIGMLTYMEKSFCSGGKSGGASGAVSLERDGSKDARDKSEGPEDVQDDMKIRICQYKAQCYLKIKSMKSCKREIKLLTNAIPSTTFFGYIKSNFEYIRGNYRKASKILGSTLPAVPTQELGPGEQLIPLMYNNNLGATHFHMRKHNLGSYFFSKAMAENEKVMQSLIKTDTGKPESDDFLFLKCTSLHYELMYNIGIELLHCGKPVAAFDCLMEAAQRFQTNPRLWLRLAECCIMEYRPDSGLITEEKSLAKSLEAVRGSIGTGVHRKLILGTGVENYNPSNQSAAIPVARLEFAALCLRNALALLPDDPTTFVPPVSEDAAEGSKVPEVVLVPAPPANPMRPSEVANLRCSILCAASYVSLCLHDYVPAIAFAESLLKQSRLSGAQRYLGKMYLAEAMVAVDKIADAIQLLLTEEDVTDLASVPPEQKSDQERLEKEKAVDKGEKETYKGPFYPWVLSSLSTASAVIQHNLAASHAIRGEFEKALTHLDKSFEYMGHPLAAQMCSLRLYLDLIEGRRKSAQVFIKTYFGHTTPNRVGLGMPSGETASQ